MAVNQFIVNYTVGPDAYNEVPAICGAYGKKAVVIGGKRALAAARPVLEEAIKDSDITVTDYIWYGGEAAIEYAEEIAATQAYKDADMVFVFGGGKAIDTAKYAARLVDHKPFFTFPTIAATCAAASAEAIMYYTNHEARDTYAVHETATHVFVNTKIIAEAPDIYLWAGIGDTMAKHFETSLAVKDGHKITLGQALGVHIGDMCYKPLVQYGAKAMEDCKNNIISEELEIISLTNIVTTGIVS
ncbi:MAG: iron-containing alcohol dehydrogenase, partial [Clostridia bacterium]|nr:iron-containing alcohol dehydrogenase [Clostridia bacterium]